MENKSCFLLRTKPPAWNVLQNVPVELRWVQTSLNLPTCSSDGQQRELGLCSFVLPLSITGAILTVTQ